LSGDPSLGEYIPQAPINDEAKKHNENLPGMGGVFNVVNLHVYHYAGNNPVKYTDPDGRVLETPWDIANAVFGYISGIIELNNGDYLKGSLSILGGVADTVAAFAPTIPGGVSIGIKTIQYGTSAYGAIANIAEGIMERDELKIGIGILEVFGMALGKAGSHYFEYAESAFKRAKLVPRSMVVGMILSGIRNKDLGTFFKAMSMLGISTDTIKTSYEEYKQWCEKNKNLEEK